jgi:CO/xanthine dehydrogenase Mo-binding subunit
MTTYAVVGKPVTRQEGPDKVSGTFLYAADVALPGMLWGKVLRSPFPHARIVHIDATRALRLAGVRAVITGTDTAGMRVGRMVRDVPLLAEDTVRYVGEKVAAVAAVDPDTAEEALTRIDVEYEPLPAIFDPLAAMQPGAPLVHEGAPIFASASGPIQPHGNILNHATWSAGDLAQGFRESDRIFEHTFTTTWVHQGYMEPYACVVALDAAGRIQVWANNKVPYTLRKQLADALGVAEAQIVVHPCGIGGDFGGKSPAMNVPLAYFLALRSGRPVKMVMSYTEELLAGNPRHPAVVTIKTGVKNDGTFWARHSTVVYNGGAYSGFRGRPGLAGSRDAAGGQYHIPHVQVDSYMVYTHNVPCGSYRAPGQPQVVFAVESHTDMIAHAMGMDPYALRLRNVLQEGQVCATGGRYTHVRGEATLRAAVAAANWGAPKSGPYVGRGLSLGQRPQGQSVYSVTVSMDAQARATFYTLVPETGTGAHTVGRQVVAEDLGIPVEDVTAVQLDTDGGPTDAGAGSGSSVGGTHAALGAAQGVRQHLTFVAAECYGWPAERIVFRGGRVFVEGDPDQGVPIQEVAARAVAAAGAPISFTMTTAAKAPDVTCFSAQVAEVEVDPDTGAITVRKFVTAHDVGTIHNPLTHQGQIDGAIMQGVGYALMEQLVSEDGHISTLSMGEVKTPTMQDMPALVTVLVASPGGNGPYGAKTIGEQPLPPVAPAIANAVYDAVGVRIQDLPITAEKVLAALQNR